MVARLVLLLVWKLACCCFAKKPDAGQAFSNVSRCKPRVMMMMIRPSSEKMAAHIAHDVRNGMCEPRCAPAWLLHGDVRIMGSGWLSYLLDRGPRLRASGKGVRAKSYKLRGEKDCLVDLPGGWSG